MMPRQGYAPTPHSYVPNPSLSATINLDEVCRQMSPLAPRLTGPQEVKLAETRAERDLYDSLAELFSIIVTLDELEKAFLKDAIPEAEYADICERSLRQYKALLADETIAREFGGLEKFKAKWDVRGRAPPTATPPGRGEAPLTARRSSRPCAPPSASASACRPRP